jgi:ABC-type sugar transport system substrate-binding protein
MPPMNGFGQTGVADFNALRGGVFLAVETKFGSNKPTVHQKAFLQSVAAENAFGFVVTDKNINWFSSWLDAFDRAADAFSKGEKPTNEDGALMLDAIRELTALIV